MSRDFFQRLYYGLGVEYFIIAQLFSLGYEAFKLPADFGFDIIAYNQRERTFENYPKQNPKVFQIKSVMVKPDEYEERETEAGLRKIVVKDFYIKSSDLQKLRREETAYLICCFKELNEVGFEIKGYFWLSSDHLEYMKDSGFIRKVNDEENKVFIRAEFRTQAYLDKKYEEILPAIMNSNIDYNTKEKIRKLIEKTRDSLNKNSSFYIRIARLSRYDKLGEALKQYHGNKLKPHDKWSMNLPKEFYSLKYCDEEVSLPLERPMEDF